MSSPTGQDPNISPFTSAVHNEQKISTTTGLDQNTAGGLRGKLIESILQIVVQAITGSFIPGGLGSAFTQLADWATSLPVLGPIIEWLASLLGIDIGDVGDPDVDFSGIWSNVTDVFLKPLNAFAELVGGFISSLHIPILDPTKILNLPGLFTDVTNGFAGIFNAWFGGSTASGTPAEVVATITAIKTAVVNGYTIVIFNSSNPAWTVPAFTEMTGIVINGGNRGNTGISGNGSSAVAGSAAGGADGGYLSALLDMTGISVGDSLNVTVGAAAATPGATGGVSSIVATTGTLLSGAPSANGIATKEGLVNTSSQPGRGGNGGTASVPGSAATAGLAGTNSGVALGGPGGSGATNAAGGSGTSGGAGVSADVPLCGGAGGGGGGGSWSTNIGITAQGGAGGNGGFPGGGSGAGGSAVHNQVLGGAVGGSAGAPGNGLVALIYK